MAITGLLLRGSRGKVAGLTVYGRGGVTIVRDGKNQTSGSESSQAQINQRARFKLLSQLAAVFAPVAVFKRNGTQSARNLFQKKNAELVTANNGEAMATLENIQLTDSVIGLPGLDVGVRSVSAQTFQVGLTEQANGLNAVTYVVYSKQSDGSLTPQYSKVVTRIPEDPNDDEINPYFVTNLDYVEGEILVLAYGMYYTSETLKAFAKYGSMQVLTGEDIARLVATSQINTSVLKFTLTRGITQPASGVRVTGGGDMMRVFVTASPSNGGTVSGAGSFERGANVTVTATPNANFAFDGWQRNGSDTIISTSASYTITNIQNNQDLIAVFHSTGTGGGGTLNPD